MTGIVDNKGVEQKVVGYRDGGSSVAEDLDTATLLAMGSTLLGQSFASAQVSTSQSSTNQTLIAQPLYLPSARTLTGFAWFQATQGVYTANNKNRIGLYTTDFTNLTLVASTTDDGNLWKAAVGYGTKAMTSTYAAAAGLFWIIALYCRSAETTAPRLGIASNVLNNAVIAPNNNNVRLQFTQGGQTDLPSSQAHSATSATQTPTWFGVY